MGPIMARKNHDQNAVRRYLLRQLSDAEQQTFELRLLSDDELSEEFILREIVNKVSSTLRPIPEQIKRTQEIIT